jgi:hypothetical protein
MVRGRSAEDNRHQSNSDHERYQYPNNIRNVASMRDFRREVPCQIDDHDRPKQQAK